MIGGRGIPKRDRKGPEAKDGATAEDAVQRRLRDLKDRGGGAVSSGDDGGGRSAPEKTGYWKTDRDGYTWDWRDERV